MAKSVYRVCEGIIESDIDVKLESDLCDWQTSCLCLANGELHALALAADYDNGLIQPDNMAYQGETIVVLS